MFENFEHDCWNELKARNGKTKKTLFKKNVPLTVKRPDYIKITSKYNISSDQNCVKNEKIYSNIPTNVAISLNKRKIWQELSYLTDEKNYEIEKKYKHTNNTKKRNKKSCKNFNEVYLQKPITKHDTDLRQLNDNAKCLKKLCKRVVKINKESCYNSSTCDCDFAICYNCRVEAHYPSFNDNYEILLSKKKNFFPRETKTKCLKQKFEIDDPLIEFTNEEFNFQNEIESVNKNVPFFGPMSSICVYDVNRIFCKELACDTQIIISKLNLCEICFNETIELAELDKCHHKACINCWQSYLEHRIQPNCNQLKCMYNDCNTTINLEFLEDYLQKPLVNKYIKYYCDLRLLQSNDYAKCLKQGCERVIKINKESCYNSSMCDCGFAICNSCQEEAHYPISCDNLETYRAEFNEQALVMMELKKCPQCGMGIEKVYGCSHMTCFCGKEFCWDCSGNFNVKHSCSKKKPVLIYVAFFNASALQKLYQATLFENSFTKMTTKEINEQMNIIVQSLKQKSGLGYFEMKLIFNFLLEMRTEMEQLQSILKHTSYNELIKYSRGESNENKNLYGKIKDAIKLSLNFFKLLKNVNSLSDIYKLYLLNIRAKKRMESIFINK